MPAPSVIFDLVARFRTNLDSYKRGQYNETQVRREFIAPFFEALGWDVTNRQGYAEAYKDENISVVEEAGPARAHLVCLALRFGLHYVAVAGVMPLVSCAEVNVCFQS